ncbi:MAG TPA: NADH-quinone oxidoreductase subunit NuoE [Candidatus Acidoferrales bacterium]|nr:NADH-quinone oxidoreductase subunit NuoE [Candidatus Acidoferrales bacterium]
MFTEENLRKVEEIKKRYPTQMAAVLPVLWLAQEQFGWISEEVMHYVAELLEVPFSHVLGVVTFYTMYSKKPVGKYHIQVCANVSCMLRGSDNLVEHLEKRLGVRVGETTPDKMFTLDEVECLGSCGTAPMMQINDDYYENLTMDQTDHLLDEFRNRKSAGSR